MKAKKTRAYYMQQLRDAKTDEIPTHGGTPLMGNLANLANLACCGITSQAEREETAIALLQAAHRIIGQSTPHIRAVATELIARWDKSSDPLAVEARRVGNA